MEGLTNWMQEHIAPLATKLGQNKYLQAISGGMMHTMPLTIGVVFIHFSLQRGLEIHGVFHGLNNPGWFFFIVNLMSEVIARLCVPTFFIISGFLFFLSRLPETKGKSLEQLEQELTDKQ